MYQLSGNAIQVSIFIFLYFHYILAKENKKVFVTGHYSPERSVEVGVPQGSVFGRLLFNIYINDLPLSILSNEVDCDMFADDSSLSASGNNIAAINAAINSCYKCQAAAKQPRNN